MRSNLMKEILFVSASVMTLAACQIDQKYNQAGNQPEFIYPLLDPADAGHPATADWLMLEGRRGDVASVRERNLPQTTAPTGVATVLPAEPVVVAEAPKGEMTACGKVITSRSENAVANPCLTQAEFISTLRLDARERARLREFGMSEQGLAH